MHKILYLLKRIFQLDYINMFKVSKHLSQKTKKSRIFLLFDIIHCGLVYQAGYYDYQEFEFYNLNKSQRKTYLTRGKNNEIIRKFNNPDYFHFIDNKIELHHKFDKFIKHDWLYLKEATISDFVNFFSKHKSIIVKPIDSYGGQGIEKFEYKNESQSKKLYNQLISNNQLLVESYIEQHKDMNLLYSKSVNTLRMFTFYKDGKSYFLNAVLKIGNGKVVDNFSSGGMYTYIDDNGICFAPAIDQADNLFYEHPITKTKIVGFEIPMYKEAIELVKQCAKVVPEVGYVGWDVAIGKNGPDLIEGNCYPGIFQIKASLSNKKEGLIPKYNKVMNIF